jgi:hypothetical protein
VHIDIGTTLAILADSNIIPDILSFGKDIPVLHRLGLSPILSLILSILVHIRSHLIPVILAVSQSKCVQLLSNGIVIKIITCAKAYNVDITHHNKKPCIPG